MRRNVPQCYINHRQWLVGEEKGRGVKEGGGKEREGEKEVVWGGEITSILEGEITGKSGKRRGVDTLKWIN